MKLFRTSEVSLVIIVTVITASVLMLNEDSTFMIVTLGIYVAIVLTWFRILSQRKRADKTNQEVEK
ncbi:hypothetical protein LC087_15990 [Bacillus carboniphilus]|uniref:Uncharacterized protein n=1 Tax=Bacillus carboniphilus TaxID=86663 RepID=A0ABY9JS55_9BACI|nr:hypothetical protein [Bacillus carboniphilus]WLR42221.1 hypothetical protein LC087_15990 [Bacillus carboniphilus]